jgi:glycosyltransferase involved in cell wall biosynthesis
MYATPLIPNLLPLPAVPSQAPLLGATRTTPARRRLHVVIVDEELPYPPTSGKRIRTLNLTLRLARHHDITYLCHRNTDHDEARRASAFFATQGIEPLLVDRVVPRKSGAAFYARLAANLLSPLPYSVASHNSRALRQAIATFAAQHTIDLWHCEWTPYAAALRVLRQGRKLVMAHNVESLIWQRYYETATDPLKRWYIHRQWRKFERFEAQAFAEADRAVAVSAPDAQLIRERFGAARVHVVENGVDLAYFRPAVAVGNHRQVLFLGSLDWRPNLDAIALLLDGIFPKVRAAEPSTRLCIVGRNPPLWLRRRVASRDGVSLHANVADVRPFLAQSAVLAVPLRIGGGSRLKILEALACGLPVVSTCVGAEGLRLEPGTHLTTVAAVDDMAPALLQCLRAPDAARALAQRGRQFVVQHYGWDALADRLEDVWFRCVNTDA